MLVPLHRLEVGIKKKACAKKWHAPSSLFIRLFAFDYSADLLFHAMNADYLIEIHLNLNRNFRALHRPIVIVGREQEACRAILQRLQLRVPQLACPMDG